MIIKVATAKKLSSPALYCSLDTIRSSLSSEMAFESMTSIALLTELIKREGFDGVSKLMSTLSPILRSEVTEVTVQVTEKRKPGRPRLTDEEKAARKAAREAAKAQASESDSESAVQVTEKRKPGRPRLTDEEKAARKAAREAAKAQASESDSESAVQVTEKRKPGRPRLTDEEKAARKAAREAAKRLLASLPDAELVHPDAANDQ
jgi:hypothetical protein